MGKVLFGLIAYIPWLVWMIGFHIYKKIRRGEVWESDVFIPVMWILMIFGQFYTRFFSICIKKVRWFKCLCDVAVHHRQATVTL